MQSRTFFRGRFCGTGEEVAGALVGLRRPLVAATTLAPQITATLRAGVAASAGTRRCSSSSRCRSSCAAFRRLTAPTSDHMVSKCRRCLGESQSPSARNLRVVDGLVSRPRSLTTVRVSMQAAIARTIARPHLLHVARAGTSELRATRC